MGQLKAEILGPAKTERYGKRLVVHKLSLAYGARPTRALRMLRVRRCNRTPWAVSRAHRMGSR